MPVEIRVPALGESVVEATVGKWLKKEGDAVKVGEAVVELETEKVNLELAAESTGIIARIDHKAGETVRVGEILAVLDESGSAAPPAPPAVAAVNGGSAPAAPVAVAAEPQTEIAATPVAKTLATKLGVDLAQVPGTGQGGRVTQEDVTKFAEQRAPAAAAAAPAPVATAPAPVVSGPAPAPAAPAAPPRPATPAPAPAPAPVGHVDISGGRPEERVHMSRLRMTIARRLKESQNTAAQLTTYNEVDMSAVMDLRTRHRESFEKRNSIRLGFMSFFTKAAVGALKAYPVVNAEVQGDDVIYKKYYDIGIAMGTDQGLVVPVVRNADRLTFADIEKQIDAYSKKAQGRTFTMEDLQGGTFTISNGGVYGSMWSMPILNSPQVGILGLHKIEQRPMAINGEVVIKPMMYLALTYDHRIIDGREAVLFLVRIKELIESPESLLLEG